MPETNTLKKNYSTIGLKNLVIAPIISDTEETLTYGEIVKVSGVINATITPSNSDADIGYADDVEYSVIYPDPDTTFKTKMVDIPLTVQEMIFSNNIDANGVLIRSSRDEPKYFAVGFKSEKADGTYRYVWLYKCRAKPVTEEYATREGNKLTRQEPELEWTSIKRTHDNLYQAVADEGLNGFTAEKAATFLDTVYGYTPKT